MRTGWLSFMLLTGCDDAVFEGHSSESSGTDETGYAGTVDIVTNSCLSGCHDAASQAGGLDLETDFCGSTVGVASLSYSDVGNIIEAGDSASSVLYLKMSEAEGVGGGMPIGGALDAEPIAVVGDWIDAGADCTADTSGTDSGDTSGTDSGTPDSSYDFATIASDIWGQCTGCHADGGTSVPHFGDDPGNLINQQSNYYSGQTLVVPGDPESSWLYLKVRGLLPENHGDQMPPYGDGLSTDELTLIYGWILELEE